MSRIFLALAVFAIHVSFSCWPASAQTSAPGSTVAERPMQFGTVKVAVVNVGVVFNKYERAIAFKQEIEENMQEMKDEAREVLQNMKTWEAALRKEGIAPAKKAQYEEKLITCKRRLEDLDRKVRQTVGKVQENNLIALWKDVREGVKEFSKVHGIELVIAYGDPLDKATLDLFPNINRKMQTMDMGAALPFYVAANADISEAVVQMLNERFRTRDNDE